VAPGGAGAATWYLIVVRVVVYGLALVTAGMAAARFGWWREHIGRAWTFFVIEFAFLLLNYLLRHITPDARLTLDLTLIGVNLAQIAAYWLMARVLDAAGLSHLTSRGMKVLLTAGALFVAILVCRAPLLEQWTALGQGAVQVGALVSVVADVITFTLIAPLALSMLTLRGGYLSWMFGFLTVSVIGWMINGDAGSIAPLLGGSDYSAHSVRLAGLVIAALFNTAAALTQWTGSQRTVEGVGIDG
jgi:hypothetical protein